MTKVKQDELWSEQWPGVAAIVGNAELFCVSCAKYRFGDRPVQEVIDGELGRKPVEWGNTLIVVFHGSQDLHGEYCGRCQVPLCDWECACYPHEICEVCDESWIALPRYIRDGVCVTCRSVMPFMWVG